MKTKINRDSAIVRAIKRLHKFFRPTLVHRDKNRYRRKGRRVNKLEKP